MTIAHRLANLRPIGALYLFAVGTSLLLFAFIRETPLGLIWELVSGAGAVSLYVMPLARNARLRAVLAGVSAFVVMLHAEEWLRHAPAPLSFAVAVLWLSVLIGIISVVASDAEIVARTKLGDPEP